MSGGWSSDVCSSDLVTPEFVWCERRGIRDEAVGCCADGAVSEDMQLDWSQSALIRGQAGEKTFDNSFRNRVTSFRGTRWKLKQRPRILPVKIWGHLAVQFRKKKLNKILYNHCRQGCSNFFLYLGLTFLICVRLWKWPSSTLSRYQVSLFTDLPMEAVIGGKYEVDV